MSSLDMYVYIPNDRDFQFLFPGVYNLLLPLVSVCCTMGRPEQQPTTRLFLLLSSAAPRPSRICRGSLIPWDGWHWNHSLGQPPKNWKLDVHFNLPLPSTKRSWKLWGFLIMSFWARTGSGSECTLAKIVTFVLSGPQASRESMPVLSVFQDRW